MRLTLTIDTLTECTVHTTILQTKPINIVPGTIAIDYNIVNKYCLHVQIMSHC